MSNPNKHSRTIPDIPAYWVSIFERAMEAGDLTRAADAQRQLRRLGLDVRPVVKPAHQINRLCACVPA